MRRTPENNPELCLGQTGAVQEHCVSRVLTAWTSDTGFVLDRLESLNRSDPTGKFKGRLDMTRIGVFGHSLGGATALQFCSEDARCQAGIDVDGAPHGSVIQTGVRQPFMFLMSDHSRESDPESRQILANIQSIYDRLPADGRARIAIRGANHFMFSDDGALLKGHLVRGWLRAFGKLGIDGDRQLAITSYCVRRFFDACLKGTRVSEFEVASPQYPEIQVLN
jgi:pimeloyl-ACP methyl ester carboxylesterase